MDQHLFYWFLMASNGYFDVHQISPGVQLAVQGHVLTNPQVFFGGRNHGDGSTWLEGRKLWALGPCSALSKMGIPPEFHGLSWFIMFYHGLSWFIMVYSQFQLSTLTILKMPTFPGCIHLWIKPHGRMAHVFSALLHALCPVLLSGSADWPSDDDLVPLYLWVPAETKHRFLDMCRSAVLGPAGSIPIWVPSMGIISSAIAMFIGNVILSTIPVVIP